MPRLTGRGYALLGLAAGTYGAARLIGTWELYLFAFALLGVLVCCWLLVAVSGRKISVLRSLSSDRLVDGDEPELHLAVRNDSFLPAPTLTLHCSSTDFASAEVDIEVDNLPPRSSKDLKVSVGRVNRGVHTLPPVSAEFEDPLGVARTARRVSEVLTVTVLPRITHLYSCALCPDFGLKHDWSGRRGLPTSGAAEFRGIRPHQPGEPLSRIDWKSTAKTGVLMMREMEEPAGADLTIILDGTAGQVRGRAPLSNYELAVRAAGSIADFVLRSGRGVTLVRHEKTWRQIRLSPDGSGQRSLLQSLAEAKADATSPLSHLIQRLRREARYLLRAQGVSIVVLGLDPLLARTLLELREDGARVAVIYAATSQTPEIDSRRLLLSLSSAGIPCISVEPNDDLRERLSLVSPVLPERIGVGRR
ncbi:MAG: DUF58 domain-containing protein [Thermoleophilia bacterium]|nr:DUF58 domain-containing protein [Thermoleophilia bacterium]